MIRVAHIAAGLETGGGELFLERLVGALHGREFEQHVISMLDAGPVGARMRASGVDAKVLGCHGKTGALAGLYKLGSDLKRLRPDIVQGWLYHGNLAAWAGLRFSGVRCPLLWNIRHSLDQWAEESLFWRSEIRLGGWLGGAPQRIVFNSAHAARQHERLGYPSVKACVIPNGFDLEKFAPDGDAGDEMRSELGIGTNDVVFGIVGRYHPLKDYANFLRAAAIVAAADSAARFVLVGRRLTKDNRELMALIHDSGLKNRVIFLGERDDIPNLMNAFDIYVSSSSSEAFPNVVGEAMSCSLPCVVTDVGDSSELVGDSGIVVPPKSPQALAKGMLELAHTGADRRRELGAAARERIRLNYSMERIALQYADLYRLVCEEAREARAH